MGTHVALDRGIRLVNEKVGQAGACPRVIAHRPKVLVSD
jgi:hypothetical protein